MAPPEVARDAQQSRPTPARGRPRVEGIRSAKAPDGSRTIEVTLSWPDGTRSAGHGASVGLPEAEDRAAAEATLAAILDGPTLDRSLRLRGTKAVRAFDHLVIVAAVDRGIEGRSRPLIGSVCAPKADRIRGAVLATLNAVNRVIEGKAGPSR